MRFISFCLLFNLPWYFAVYAQHDTTSRKVTDTLHQNRAQPAMPAPDSAALAQGRRQQFTADSIAMVYLKPDTARMQSFAASITKNMLFDAHFKPPGQPRQKGLLPRGRPRNLRDPWIIIVLTGLLTFTGLLNIFFNRDIKTVVQSFYNKHALSQLDKEGGLINSWAFLGLFVLFSLTSGLVLYQLTTYYNYYQSLTGMRLFLAFSAAVSMLFAIKFIVLKFIGFVFDIKRQVSEYITVLNLTYFNIAFLLLFVAICFSLLNTHFIRPLLVFTLVSIAAIFAWQYLRKGVSIISDFRLHKFYLFIYLCALEICPVLILIKALNI